MISLHRHSVISQALPSCHCGVTITAAWSKLIAVGRLCSQLDWRARHVFGFSNKDHLLVHISMSWKFGLGLAGWFFCQSHLGQMVGLGQA